MIESTYQALADRLQDFLDLGVRESFYLEQGLSCGCSDRQDSVELGAFELQHVCVIDAWFGQRLPL